MWMRIPVKKKVGSCLKKIIFLDFQGVLWRRARKKITEDNVVTIRATLNKFGISEIVEGKK